MGLAWVGYCEFGRRSDLQLFLNGLNLADLGRGSAAPVQRSFVFAILCDNAGVQGGKGCCVPVPGKSCVSALLQRGRRIGMTRVRRVCLLVILVLVAISPLFA